MILSSVCQSVCHSGKCAKTAERIDVLFGVEIPGNVRNIVLDGGLHLPGLGGAFDAAFAKVHWSLIF